VQAPPFGRAYLLRISTTDYEADRYVWFSAEISNPYNRLVNASIAAVYRRPSPADTSVYSPSQQTGCRQWGNPATSS
jgi:hypothetical protein